MKIPIKPRNAVEAASTPKAFLARQPRAPAALDQRINGNSASQLVTKEDIEKTKLLYKDQLDPKLNEDLLLSSLPKNLQGTMPRTQTAADQRTLHKSHTFQNLNENVPKVEEFNFLPKAPNEKASILIKTKKNLGKIHKDQQKLFHRIQQLNVQNFNRSKSKTVLISIKGS